MDQAERRNKKLRKEKEAKKYKNLFLKYSSHYAMHSKLWIAYIIYIVSYLHINLL